LHISDNYERRIENEFTSEYNYIFGSDGLAAVFVSRSNNTEDMYYVHKDHLGSIMEITNEEGEKLDAGSASFDAWGDRRNPQTWQPYSETPPRLLFDRGFTGHEHYDRFGIINMNGRCYDPKIGRFLSPDVTIQNPENSQNFNRYSYCMNNPLNLIDPTGYDWEDYEGDDDGKPQHSWFSNVCSKSIGPMDPLPTIVLPLFEVIDHRTSGIIRPIECSHILSDNNNTAGNFEHRDQTRPNDKSEAGGCGDEDEVLDTDCLYLVDQDENDNGDGEDEPAGRGGFNEDKAINYLKDNFTLPYGAGQCINNMVQALIEGGISGLKGKPIKAACLYGPILKGLGFATVNRTITYYKGDIAIIQGYDGGKYCKGSKVVCGHIQMYDGNQWLSDFPQSRPFWPGKGYADARPSPSFEILHWPGN